MRTQWATVAFAAGMLLATGAYAATTQIDLSKLDRETAQKVIDATKGDASIDHTKAWVGVGKEIAEAISQTARGVNTEVNDFVKTPAGYWTVVLIVWFVIGKTIAHVAIALLLFGTLWAVWYRCLRHFFWGYKDRPPLVASYSGEGRGLTAFAIIMSAAAIFGGTVIAVFSAI